jgi:hypothetical protein
VVVGAADAVGVVAVEPKDHTILVVDPDGVIPGQIPHEGVQSIARRNLRSSRPTTCPGEFVAVVGRA